MTTEPGEPQPLPTSAFRPRAPAWQVGIRTLILLTAVFAVWMTAWINRNEVERLEKRNQPMRSIARVLMVDDVTKYAVVKLDSLWMNDHRWDVSLPPGEYRVSMSTREVGAVPRKPAHSAKLGGGRHRLALDFRRKKDGWPIRLTSDGIELIACEEAKSWGSSGSSSDHLTGVQSEQLPANEPLVLFRREFMDPKQPGGPPEGWKPGEGLLLWIERVKPDEPASAQ